MIQAKELKCPDKYNHLALKYNTYNNVFYTTLPFYVTKPMISYAQYVQLKGQKMNSSVQYYQYT